MYHVLIVDDEPIVSVTIKSLIPWEDYHISMAYEAHNGRQALNLLENHPEIDIVITDISMPVMDGLELIKVMKERQLSPAIIVLSAYEDYRLVRNAFKLGVRDYILKTEMDGGSLLTLLKNVTEKLRQEMPHSAAPNPSAASDPRNLAQRESLLESLLTDAPGEMPCSREVLRLREENLMVALVQVDDFQLVEERSSAMRPGAFSDGILTTIRQSLSQLAFGEAVCLEPDRYVIVLSFPQWQAEDIHAAAHQLLFEIKSNLANFMNLHVSIGVSGLGQKWENLPMLYRQANGNGKFRFLLGRKQIIFPEETGEICVSWDAPSTELRAFEGALTQGDDRKIQKLLERNLSCIASLSVPQSEKYGRYLEILRAAVLCARKLDVEVSFCNPEINLYQELLGHSGSREIHAWLRQMIDAWLRARTEKSNPAFSLPIAKAISFTREHFRDENMSVRIVSSHLGLSENHFSTLFRKEVGETFTGYLTDLRIGEAKKLMKETNLKIYEICDQIGYSNVEHFSRSFKKATGYSPNQYKKRYTAE